MIYKASLAIGGLILVVLVARWSKKGTMSIHSGNDATAATRRLRSRTGHTPTAHAGRSDLTNLDRWLQQHSDQINRRPGAFCQAPLHTAAHFGHKELAELLISRGADVARVTNEAAARRFIWPHNTGTPMSRRSWCSVAPMSTL